MGVPIIPTRNALQTTLAGSLSAGETGSFTTADDFSSYLSGASATRPFWVVVDRVDANGTATPSTREYIKVTGISGTTLSGLTRGQGGSTGQSHNAGAVVELVPDVDTFNAFIDAFLEEHSSSGSHSFSGTLSIAGEDTGAAELRLAEDTDNGTNYMGIKAPAAVTTSTTLTLPNGDGTSGQTLLTNGSGTLSWGAGGLISTTQYAPVGFLINGRITPSVASNNLTVAVKGMDGNDPSASNPVYIRIGNTVRAITAALSVTKNAGTNWFDSGSASLATKEVDYFVYIGYNDTDGVVIGFARIPFARTYGDFSATTTNEKYCAISTITTAASTDEYQVIGRFAATLSAGAGYTWTVPTFTPINLLQRPIFETRFLSYTPVYTGFSADPGTIVSSYKLIGSVCFYSLAEGANGTSNATSKSVTLPFTVATGGSSLFITTIVDNGTQAYGKHLLVAGNATTTSYPAVNTANWTGSGNCRLAPDGVMFIYSV